MTERFRSFAESISELVGTAWAFTAALALVVVWAALGPLFKFTDTWQLVINTGTTIITFLVVFLIQNTQNRQGKALQLKLDELIQTQKGARREFVDLEDLNEKELDQLERQFRVFKEKKRKSREGARTD